MVDEDDEDDHAGPMRPVAVLDANVLIPPGLRDLLLSCADAAVFRPVRRAGMSSWPSPSSHCTRKAASSLWM